LVLDLVLNEDRVDFEVLGRSLHCFVGKVSGEYLCDAGSRREKFGSESALGLLGVLRGTGQQGQPMDRGEAMPTYRSGRGETLRSWAGACADHYGQSG